MADFYSFTLIQSESKVVKFPHSVIQTHELIIASQEPNRTHLSSIEVICEAAEYHIKNH